MSEQQTINIKQRLIGAVVLVSLGIILIPLLLNGGKDSDNIISDPLIPQLPARLEAKIPETPKPLKMPEAQTIVSYPVEKNNFFKNSAKKTDNSTLDKPITQKTTEKKITLENKETESKKTTLLQSQKANVPKNNKIVNAYTLQVASFSKKNNAFTLRDKMRKKKFKAYIESVNTSGGKIYRLRVGPYLKYNQILNIKNQVEKQFKISKTVIVKYQT